MNTEELIIFREAEKAKLAAAIDEFAEDMKLRLAPAIDEFVEDMKARAFQKVDEGYTGWDSRSGWTNKSPEDRLADIAWSLQSGIVKDDLHSRMCVDAAVISMFARNLRCMPVVSISQQE